MITDIPCSSDFREAGIKLLDLAWDQAVSLMCSSGGDPEDDFWDAFKQETCTALSLAQQGIEFLIKSKICEIHPLLLLAPNQWPGKAPKSFSDMRTVDAHDLIKCHDSLVPIPIPESFATVFDELRRKRNTIMHSVSKSFPAHEVVLGVLEASEALLGPRSWMPLRKHSLRKSAYDYEEYVVAVQREIEFVMDLLSPASCRAVLGIDTRRRFYECPECPNSARDSVPLAQLQPNTASSTTIHCFVCSKDFTVKRSPCQKAGCKGNVIDVATGTCLTCFE